MFNSSQMSVKVLSRLSGNIVPSSSCSMPPIKPTVLWPKSYRYLIASESLFGDSQVVYKTTKSIENGSSVYIEEETV